MNDDVETGSTSVTRIALIDSGVKRAHPHLVGMGDVVCGPTFLDGGVRVEGDQVDRLIHGTPAASLILAAAPGATVISLKVFDTEPTCPFERILDAFDHALACEVGFINLSLGTTTLGGRAAVESRVRSAVDAGVRVIAPAEFQGMPSYPGSLEGVDGVIADPTVEGDPILEESNGRSWWRASPFALDIPGIPRERNRQGASFAVARVTGHVARGT